MSISYRRSDHEKTGNKNYFLLQYKIAPRTRRILENWSAALARSADSNWLRYCWPYIFRKIRIIPCPQETRLARRIRKARDEKLVYSIYIYVYSVHTHIYTVIHVHYIVSLYLSLSFVNDVHVLQNLHAKWTCRSCTRDHRRVTGALYTAVYAYIYMYIVYRRERDREQ